MGSAHNGYTLDGDRLDCHIPRPLNIFDEVKLKIPTIFHSKEIDLFCNSKIAIPRFPANNKYPQLPLLGDPPGY